MLIYGLHYRPLVRDSFGGGRFPSLRYMILLRGPTRCTGTAIRGWGGPRSKIQPLATLTVRRKPAEWRAFACRTTCEAVVTAAPTGRRPRSLLATDAASKESGAVGYRLGITRVGAVRLSVVSRHSVPRTQSPSDIAAPGLRNATRLKAIAACGAGPIDFIPLVASTEVV